MKINILLFVVFVLTILSCKQNKKFYYPDKNTFLDKSKERLVLEFSLFSNFDNLVDSLEKINCSDKKAVFNIKKEGREYCFIASTFFGECYGVSKIKLCNVLSITKDSILKIRKKYSIDSLDVILKRDLLNRGRDMSFSQSSEKLIVSVTDKIVNLESLLLRIFKSYNCLKKESNDSLKLNIQLNRRIEILPIPPLIKK